MTGQQQPLALPSTSRGKAPAINGDTLDALPYIDDVNYTESHRQLALQLIQAECRNFPMSAKKYLRQLPEPRYDAFLTPRITEYFAKLADKKEIEKIDMKRYEVPAPSGTKATDKRAWQSAIQNCKSQLGNQYLRKMNLEILEDYGSEAFLQHNKLLHDEVASQEGEVTKLRNQLYEINARRKRSQLAAGEQLDQLGRNWVDLVSKNARMEVELMELEKDVYATAKRLKVEPGLQRN